MPAARREQRQVFPIGEERRVRAQVGGDFHGLVLLDRGPRGLQGMVVLERQLDGLVERDLGGSAAAVPGRIHDCATQQRKPAGTNISVPKLHALYS